MKRFRLSRQYGPPAIRASASFEFFILFLEIRKHTSSGPARVVLKHSPNRMHFRNLEEFWPFYMNQHTKASTRRWHFFGTLSATIFLLAAFLVKWWLLFFAPIFGYGLAWYSHFFVEGNVPASYGHPLWSFVCDWKMFGLMLTGRMDKEIKRLGKRPILQVS